MRRQLFEIAWRAGGRPFQLAWVRRLGMPQGRLGQVVGWFLARGNAAQQAAVLDAVRVPAGGTVVDVACGPGVLLSLFARSDATLQLHGVDPSPDMLRQASRRNRHAVTAGRLRLHQGLVTALPFDDRSVDVATAVNAVYFWPRPEAAFRELARVLRPGGVLALGYRPADEVDDDVATRFREAGHRTVAVDEVEAWLTAAGFVAITTMRATTGTVTLAAPPPR